VPLNKTEKNKKIRDDLELNAIQLVQANVCTLHPGELKHAKTKQNCGSTARMIFLDNAFAEAGACVVCIQEARVPGDGLHSCQNFRMYRSGADEDGSHGVQVWILHKFARMVTAVNPISSRLLHVVVQVGPLFLHIISAHAPIEAATVVCKEAFWSSLQRVTSSLGSSDANLVLIGIDANARVGELQCEGIGNVAPEDENDNGARLREFLCESGLIAINTFHDAGTTWTSSFGTKTRIDYVLASQNLFELVSNCSTCHDIDLATAVRDDHMAILTGFNDVASLFAAMASKVGRSSEFARSRQQQPRKYSAESLRDPDNRWCFQHAVASAWLHSQVRHRQRCNAEGDRIAVLKPSANDVDSDVKLLVGAMREAADSCFDAQSTAPHKQWLSQRTWEVVSFANSMRTMRRRMLCSQRTHLLGLTFRLWLSVLSAFNGASHVVLCGVMSSCSLYDSVCAKTDWKIALLERNIRTACRLRAQYVVCDKVASIENAADDAQSAANANDSKKLFSIVRRLAGVPQRALNTLKDAAGKVVSSSSDLAALWRTHFSNVFKANVIDELPLTATNSSDDPTTGDDPDAYYIDWSTFETARQMRDSGFAPTVDDVEAVICTLKGDSGVGTDQLSAWLLKAGGRPVAVMVWEVVSDILDTKHVPMVWRGGRLVVLFKGKGTPTDPDNYRGILVSDHLGKILTALLQRHLNQLYARLVGPSQFGAVSGRGTALASLSLRAFADLCMARGWSLFVLFVDLSKAFDYAIREVVMGWMGPMRLRSRQDKRKHLHGLGVLPEHSDDLVQWIDETGGLLLAAGADHTVVSLVASLHDGSWFQLPNDDKFIVSASGGRQGCKLGALVFNAIYSVALARVRAELVQHDVILYVKNCSTRPFWAADGIQTSFSKDCLVDNNFSQTLEITYVDDEAIHIAASSPKVLMAAIPIVMRHLCQVFAYFGFKINWKPGKTECFLTLRGKHANAQKSKLTKVDGQISIPLPPECGHPALRVVRKYIHLGSGLDNHCNPSPDVQIRTSSAMAAFAPISKKVFGNPRVARMVRMRLLMSLVVSRLLYNVHVWSCVTQAAYNRLNSVYMRGLRRIADKTKFDAVSAHANGSDSYVRTLLGAPSLQCILLQRRLLLFATVLRNGSRSLSTLLSARGRDGSPMPWVRLVRNDLQHLARCCADKMSELGDPLENFEAWASVAVHFPREWKSLVKRCHLTSMELDANSQKKFDPGHWGSQPPLSHSCLVCEAAFSTAKALESHRRAKHKSRAAFSTLLGSSKVCPCCHTEFSSRPRLLAHVSERRNRGGRRYSCNTLFATGLVHPPSHDELQSALEADKETRSLARKSGHTVPLSECLAKRPRVGTTVLEQQRARKRMLEAGHSVTSLPANALHLCDLRPRKRFRSKSSQEEVVLQHISQ
jgi:exonuclease III